MTKPHDDPATAGPAGDDDLDRDHEQLARDPLALDPDETDTPAARTGEPLEPPD
ncbi:hypothetical protein ACQP00_30455 [Dactylosporangium sp. CS-047395]|uniref:hypothetical protein n=1 Tax=Dactylosporangium sp. CS-047395 TaxID=3239936 RepID=UPI003D94DC97